MKKEITIMDAMLVIIIIIFVIMMAWWILGNSPTLEMLGTFLSLVFLFFTFKNEKDMKTVKENTGKTLNKLEDIYNILKERLK